MTLNKENQDLKISQELKDFILEQKLDQGKMSGGYRKTTLLEGGNKEEIFLELLDESNAFIIHRKIIRPNNKPMLTSKWTLRKGTLTKEVIEFNEDNKRIRKEQSKTIDGKEVFYNREKWMPYPKQGADPKIHTQDKLENGKRNILMEKYDKHYHKTRNFEMEIIKGEIISKKDQLWTFNPNGAKATQVVTSLDTGVTCIFSYTFNENGDRIAEPAIFEFNGEIIGPAKATKIIGATKYPGLKKLLPEFMAIAEASRPKAKKAESEETKDEPAI